MTGSAEAVARSASTLATRIGALPETGRRRRLVAIAGPPGTGKSTLGEAVVAELVTRGRNAVLMSMDGFHLDNRLLAPRGLLPRKGAPETFDFGGFLSAIRRIRDEPSVVLPVFDRSREIAIAGAEEVGPETRIVVVEGNYLCFDEDPWRALMNYWDFSVFLDTPMDELERRLVDRWLGHGFAPEDARGKALGNDIPNARRIAGAIAKVDLVIRHGA